MSGNDKMTEQSFLREDNNNRLGEIYSRTRQSVLDGYFLPSQVVDLAGAVHFFQCSAEEFRTVLKLLKSEGYFSQDLALKWRVRRWNSQEVNDAFDMRKSLSALAVEKCCDRLSLSSIERLRQIADVTKPSATMTPAESENLLIRMKAFFDYIYRGSVLSDISDIMAIIFPAALHRMAFRGMTIEQSQSYLSSCKIVCENIAEGNKAGAVAASDAALELLAKICVDDVGARNLLVAGSRADFDGIRLGSALYKHDHTRPYFGFGGFETVSFEGLINTITRGQASH